MPVNSAKPIARRVLFAISVFVLVALTFISARAQSDAVSADFLNVYNLTTDKVSQLAGAFPADKINWRPAEGIRSAREAVLHVASGNYFFGSMLGAEVPVDIDPQALANSDMGQAEAISALQKSVTFVQNAVKNMTEEDFNTKIDFFGNEVTKRQVMFTLGDHAAEHLGQLIAYARSNGVVPPWSQ